MKNSIVFLVAVGCFLLSNCADVGSYYRPSSLNVERMVEAEILEVRLAQIEHRLDNCEKRPKKLDNPLFGISIKNEKRLETLEQSRDLRATYELTEGEDRLKKIEKSLEQLWAKEWERTKKEYSLE